MLACITAVFVARPTGLLAAHQTFLSLLSRHRHSTSVNQNTTRGYYIHWSYFGIYELFFEPMGRIELPTYSFAYTFSPEPRGEGLDCIFISMRCPCQSFGRRPFGETPRSWPVGLLTVIRDSYVPRGTNGQGSLRPTMELLYP